MGLTLGLIFKRKFMLASLGAGIGGGISINLTANEFNKI